MDFHTEASPAARAAVQSLQYLPFWLDDTQRPEELECLRRSMTCDLLVVGGGFTGLWMALHAQQAHPDWQIVVLEGGRIAEGGSGRNGGFMSHSLTHGFGNGMARWPDQMPNLLQLGYENLAAIEAFIVEEGIDCDLRRGGDVAVALADHQVQELRQAADVVAALGAPVQFLDRSAMQARINSPTYLAGLVDPEVALVNPARLVWGLQQACLKRGIVIHEYSPVQDLQDAGDHVIARVRPAAGSPQQRVRARRVALATNAYPALLRRINNYMVRVWDYVIVTEPLTQAQWAQLGWQGRDGVSDAGNQFHYYRPTADGRILWGGYDAIYHRGNGFNPQYEVDDAVFARLAEHFFQTFPQLQGVSFTHGWGGAIDTCSRFSPFWGTAHGGKTSYVAGYTGLGVGSSRFGAQVMLDLLDAKDAQPDAQAQARLSLTMVRTRPIPFPPEPLRSLGIAWTVASLRRADRNGGRRNIWLRTLDRLGMGFDS
ncbi:MAG: FAD-dependent oxidoreductase [Actinomycetales bacterium]|nr:FAD-dependent oxidoreductase [Actinomycetales bacterium]